MLKAAFRTASELFIAIAAIGIAVDVGLNLAQIIARYVFFSPFAWTEEAMRYVMVWVTMVGVAATIYRGEEMTAGLLGAIPSAGLQKALHLLRVALVFTAGALLAWYGVPFALSVGNQVSPAAQFPMVVPFMAIGIGGVLMAVMAIGMLIAPHEHREGELKADDIS